MGITCRINALRGRSSVVERHVANVNVEGSTPFARFDEGSWSRVDCEPFLLTESALAAVLAARIFPLPKLVSWYSLTTRADRGFDSADHRRLPTHLHCD